MGNNNFKILSEEHWVLTFVYISTRCVVITAALEIQGLAHLIVERHQSVGVSNCRPH